MAPHWSPGSGTTAGTSIRAGATRWRVSLDEAEVGDVGIHLIRSFASGMNYERREVATG